MNVYRVDGRTGKPPSSPRTCWDRTGSCFSPDEKMLYLVESRGVPTRNIKVYDVVAAGDKLANKREFADLDGGTPDGFRCDIEGNLWCGWGRAIPNSTAWSCSPRTAR